MKKVFKLHDLDCAACAAKMEAAIKKLDGVSNASVSFMTQRLTIESDADMEDIVKKAAKICKKIEPDCTIEF
jgi:copper chaperone CopZ